MKYKKAANQVLERLERQIRKEDASKLAERERSDDEVLSAVWSANTNPSGTNGWLLPG
jgi:hypothetical protein